MAQDCFRGQTPAQTKESAFASPSDGYWHFLELVKSGQAKRQDLITVNTDFFSGHRELASPFGLKSGFSDLQLWDGFNQFLKEMTGEANGFELLQNILDEEKPEAKQLNNYQDRLTWTLATLDDDVNIGVDIVAEDSKELSRTYYIFKPKESIRISVANTLGRILFDPR